jgi:hypothetical protein
MAINSGAPMVFVQVAFATSTVLPTGGTLPSAPQALAILHAQAGQRAEALAWAERYLALATGNPQAQRLVAELRARR